MGHDEEGTLQEADMPAGGTLIVCPKSVLATWEAEIRAKMVETPINCNLYPVPFDLQTPRVSLTSLRCWRMRLCRR